MSKRPAFQFYPSDWRNDAGLRLCSMGARGLWMEMMCLMHDGSPYGHLTVLGRPMTPDSLARLTGEGPAAIKRWLGELEANDVCSRNDEGVIFSRRMVRDEQIRDARAAGGIAGAEHGSKGASHGAKGGRPRKEKPPLGGEERGVSKPSPSSSSSSPSPSPDNSDADASGGAAPPDPEKVMWDAGKRLLADAGIEAGKAGQMLGKWRRDFGAEALIVALGRAQREGAIDPISFITKALEANRANGTGGRPSGWLDA
ncbi:hypothetical protein [Sphingomonas sp. MMS24-J13]|uniref:hypothetical protein n=1 Tax=Sphingomonas sp. MMS24-J13 TaxID=3238686 RepID=UPI00384FB067